MRVEITSKYLRIVFATKSASRKAQIKIEKQGFSTRLEYTKSGYQLKVIRKRGSPNVFNL